MFNQIRKIRIIHELNSHSKMLLLKILKQKLDGFHIFDSRGINPIRNDISLLF